MSDQFVKDFFTNHHKINGIITRLLCVLEKRSWNAEIFYKGAAHNTSVRPLLRQLSNDNEIFYDLPYMGRCSHH